ncbi:hypothetical protein GGR21_003016 [Dysgonomonas hofstadii]|uniref:DUF6984 domain-containing protein n=1 Tax=Dysgonomonas hofstadii TaxID=637886 RepID=A0A840CPW9_9BACT|nr:hypothetical protein [Dysgonomonas hofstadii]MBB4037101.1 hypothetical protein [Dysgonomonas hofstadii]
MNNGDKIYISFMNIKRKPTTKELMLLKILVNKSSIHIPADWDKDLMVLPMIDGGMGSLFLLPQRYDKNEKRLFGKQASDIQFQDIDGITVIVSLNTDKKGELYELDIWKTDYSPLIEIPDNIDDFHSVE